MAQARASASAAAALGVFALAVGYATVVDPTLALILAFGPAAVYFLVNPVWGVAVAIGLLPILRPLVGSEGSTAVVSATDGILLVSVAGLVPLWLLREVWTAKLAALRPIIPFAAPYVAWLMVVLAAHPGGRSPFKTMTALEITILPVVLGACVIDKRRLTWALYGFVIASCFLACLWVAGGATTFAGNKNTAGQFLALGLLLAVVLAEGRLRGFLPVPLLIIGLLFTASRGAMVGVVFGGIALLALRGLGSWRRTATATVALSLLVVVGYNAVPTELQARVSAILQANANDSAEDLSAIQESTNYNLKIREQYRKDAIKLIQDNAVFGVGTGAYLTGQGTPAQSSDPHNFVLRAAAEGGVADAAAFLYFIGGSALLLVRRLGRNPWAGPAIAVQVSSLVHGLVDVYFIRGIPVLGWLMVGLALNPMFDREKRVG